MAVLLPPEALSEEKLDALIGRLRPRPATPELLDDLARRNRQFRSRNGSDDFLNASVSSRRKPPSFSEWLAERGPAVMSCDWHIAVSETNFDEEETNDLVAKGYLSYEKREDADYWSGAGGHSEPHRWVLYTDLSIKRADISWACPDKQIKIRPKDRPLCGGYPYFAIQMTECPGLQPFRLDKSFKEALLKFLVGIEADSEDGAERQFPDGAISFHQLLELEKIVRLQHKTP